MLIDRILASSEERENAHERAESALADYGNRAEAFLLKKLHDPDRKRSRRSIRLAIQEVRSKR